MPRDRQNRERTGTDRFAAFNTAALLAANIQTLLRERGQTQKELAVHCKHSEVWISKILCGDRAVRLKDLDFVANFFGIATYQLFQPGISPLTERRSNRDPRSGRDRRISDAQRVMQMPPKPLVTVARVRDSHKTRTRQTRQSKSGIENSPLRVD